MSRKSMAVRDGRGQINTVYFVESSQDIQSKEATFTRDEWARGVAKWQWQVDISNELGDTYEVVGNEVEDIGSGFIYRLFFVKKDKFMRRNANDIIEEYMKHWELGGYEKEKSNTTT